MNISPALKKYKQEPNSALFKMFRKYFGAVIGAELAKYAYDEDLYQASNEGLHKALIQHSTEYSDEALFKYVQLYVRGEILKELKRKKSHLEVSLEAGEIDKKTFDMLAHFSTTDGKIELDAYDEDYEQREKFYTLIHELEPDEYMLVMDRVRGLSFKELGSKMDTKPVLLRQKYQRVIKKLTKMVNEK